MVSLQCFFLWEKKNIFRLSDISTTVFSVDTLKKKLLNLENLKSTLMKEKGGGIVQIELLYWELA